MYPASRQLESWLWWTPQEQVDTVFNYQFDPLPRFPHDDSTVTSPDLTDNTLWYPFSLPDFPVTEECVGTGNPSLTVSAPLAQEYDAVTFAGSTTFFQMPGAPQTPQDHSTIGTLDNLAPGAPLVGYLFLTPSQPDLSTTTWSSQINSTTPPVTTNLGNPRYWQCPACQAEFRRWQDRDRHLLSYLPHWIHCPLPRCSWRGNRVKPFEQHWRRRHRREYHKSFGKIPGREQFEIFNPQEFINQINAGIIPVHVVAVCALLHVSVKAEQLKKSSMSANLWGYTTKQPRGDSKSVCDIFQFLNSGSATTGSN